MANVNNLPQVQASAMQTAVLPPPVTGAAAQGVAARRSFKSFVDAMDDFSADRRDVAGMRQMLAMQQENQRAAQTAAQGATSQPAQGAVLRSFAPDQGQPEIPVVRGPAPQAVPQASARAVADPYAAMPKLPSVSVPSVLPPGASSSTSTPTAIQSSAVPALPGLPQSMAAKAPVTDSGIPLLVLDPAKINPAAGTPRGDRIVGFMPISQSGADAATTTAAASADQNLPPQLRSPMVDQVRAATRGGARPGLSEEASARMNAAAERRRAMAPPIPPKLMAQEARWNRDAWTATVNGTATANGAAPANGMPSVVPSLPQLPEASVAQAAMAQQASVLPRLPGAP